MTSRRRERQPLSDENHDSVHNQGRVSDSSGRRQKRKVAVLYETNLRSSRRVSELNQSQRASVPPGRSVHFSLLERRLIFRCFASQSIDSQSENLGTTSLLSQTEEKTERRFCSPCNSTLTTSGRSRPLFQILAFPNIAHVPLERLVGKRY